MSFRHRDYEAIVGALHASGRPMGGVAEFLAAPERERRVILRHDVDRRPSHACALARLEHRLGVHSTYYFRASASGEFPSDAVRAIAGLGHEVGYHYEDLSFCRGDRQAALARFARNLAKFREIAPCVTVSMHGAPLSRHHNQDLLQDGDLARAGLLGDAVASIQPAQPFYLTDTGGSWLAVQTNLRDRVGLRWPVDALPSDGPAFRAFLLSARQPLYISTHPERWSEDTAGYLRAKAADVAVNGIKRVLRLARPPGRT